jgi:hypothetical protein
VNLYGPRRACASSDFNVNREGVWHDVGVCAFGNPG